MMIRNREAHPYDSETNPVQAALRAVERDDLEALTVIDIVNALPFLSLDFLRSLVREQRWQRIRHMTDSHARECYATKRAGPPFQVEIV